MGLSFSEKRDWLRLIRTDGVGPATFRQLLVTFGDAATAIAEAPGLAKARGRKKAFIVADKRAVEAEMEQADYLDAGHLMSAEPAYPAALKAISDAPPVICYKGDVRLLSKSSIGIVGARNASAAGRKMAATLAQELGDARLVTVSGLARGIDGAAHQASLESGTVAVVAGGIDIIYPPEHADLTQEIAKRGIIISEMPFGYPPKGRDFPRRNRLISGLSLGVAVVEAALKSGTLITARFALEQGREVFSVPGSPLDPRCQGTNKLIKDGATLIQSTDDILDVIRGMTERIMEPDMPLFENAPATTFDSSTLKDYSDADDKLRELLGFTPVHRDMLVRESGLPAGIVSAALLNLVLAGEVEESGGGSFTLCA